jgi:cytochrome b pre-mRNA-processing protein 3
MRWRCGASTTEKLYGAIVAQARLPVFYRSFGIPDTLQGRFTLLALHLFAVLHRLKNGSPEGTALTQDLVDRFSQDMETVLRELGVSDLRVPQSMRRLAAASKGLFEDYETALAADQASLAHAIAASLPGETESAELSSRALAPYLLASIEALDRQDIESLRAGVPDFAEARVKP